MTTFQNDLNSTTAAPNAREAEIDSKLAKLYTRARAAEARLDGTIDGLARAIGARKSYRTKHTWDWVKAGEVLSHDAILESATAVAATEKPLSEYGAYGAINFSPASYWLNERAEAKTELAEADAEAAPLNALYVAERWSRFFLVTSSAGGHIHKDMYCSTCNNGLSRTTFGWLPELSGLSEKDAVDAHGAILCTVCYPSAPVEWTNAHEIAAEAKAAEKCPGSGQQAPREALVARRRYAKCPHCNAVPAITSTGLLRSHKPQVAS